ncbi:Ig-like domain-containing protein [Bacillus sp. EB01]|uniref:Ig-like domain-containing protein n=1 Tax=Bacillus sp. EB01 TaxID=1347086 RepID=UPI0006943121|nr:Ig-like domain-containing protein [Bacillus sp. EB01]
MQGYFKKISVAVLSCMIVFPAAVNGSELNQNNEGIKAEEVTVPEKYLVISNESTNPNISQPSGTTALAKQLALINKNVSGKPFKFNPTKPFDAEKYKDKKVEEDKLPNYSIRAYRTGDLKYFWTYDFVKGIDVRTAARLAYSGSKANVWVSGRQISNEDAARLGTEFDTTMYKTVTANFAKESDVNGDGKINILVYDIQDGFDGNGGYIGGYFYGGDLFEGDAYNRSNMSEIFYVDTYPSMGEGTVKDVTSAYTTLVHEFQHMVNFNRTVFIEGKYLPMDTWLDESLAMAAEQVYSGRALNYRIDYYNKSESIPNGHSLLYWDDYGDVLANYSLSYLFGQYLMLQAGIGNGVYKEIISNKYDDYRAVEAIVKKYIDPGMSFGKFMTSFRTALLLKRDKGLYGFKGIEAYDAINPGMGKDGSRLKGGGAIYKTLLSDQPFSIPVDKGANVSYTIVDKAESSDTTAPEAPVIKPVDDNDGTVSGSAEPSSTITVKAGKVVLGKGTAATTGLYSVKIPVQKAGTVLTVTASDAADNESGIASVTVTDKTAPAKPVVNQVKDYDKRVTGKAEAGSTIKVKLGSTQLGYAVANGSGSFIVSLTKAHKAGTILTVTATDKVGNVSAITKTAVVDKTPPGVPTVSTVANNQKTVTGKAEPKSTVRIKRGTTQLGLAVTDAYGKFKISLPGYQKAGTVLTVTATDKAGNRSKATSKTVIDKTAPGVPVIYKVTNRSTAVTGKAEAYSHVTVKRRSTVLGSGYASSTGKYSIKIAKQRSGTALYVYAKDKAGNVSKPGSVKVASY